MAPVYDKAGSDVYRRITWYVEDGGLAYPVQRAYVKVGGSIYQYFGGGKPYALMETSTTGGQTTLYTIDPTTGALTQQGSEQTITGINDIHWHRHLCGWFHRLRSFWRLVVTNTSGQTTLYTIDPTHRGADATRL